MPKVTQPTPYPVSISQIQLERAAEVIAKLVPDTDPCAGYNIVGLLNAYLGNAEARVKINAVISAMERRQSPTGD